MSSAAINAFDMAKANYRTAVYMDTLSKRRGEARFGAGEDQGTWARVRRDQINQKGSFGSANLMAEIGAPAHDRFRACGAGRRRDPTTWTVRSITRARA